MEASGIGWDGMGSAWIGLVNGIGNEGFVDVDVLDEDEG